MRTVLGTHPVGLLLSGRLVSGIGDSIFELAMYWIVYATTHSRADVGFLGAVGGLGYVASLGTGVWADRLNARRTLIWTDLGRAGVVLGILLWALARGGRVPLPVWLVGVFLLTLMGSLFRTARSVLWVHEVPDAIRPTANGLMQSTSALAQLGGMGIAGTLIASVGAVYALGTDALAFTLSGLSLLLLRVTQAPVEAGKGDPTGPQSWRRSFREGERTLWGSPVLRRAVLLALFLNLAGTSLEVLLAAWVKGVLHASSTVYGLMGIAVLVGALLSGALFARVGARIGLTATLLVSAAVMGLSLGAFSRVSAVAPDGLCLLGFGFASGMASAALTSLFQAVVPKAQMGRVGGATSALSAAANPLGAALAGSVLAGLPLRDVFLGAGLLMLLAPITWLGARVQAPPGDGAVVAPA